MYSLSGRGVGRAWQHHASRMHMRKEVTAQALACDCSCLQVQVVGPPADFRSSASTYPGSDVCPQLAVARPSTYPPPLTKPTDWGTVRP